MSLSINYTRGHAFVVTLTSQILHNPSFNRKSKDLLIEKHQEAHLIHLVELHSSSKHSKLLSLLKGLSPRAEEYLKNEGIVHELMEFYCAAMHKVHILFLILSLPETMILVL